MKLEINLDVREDIEAAVPLLQMILAQTTKAPCSGACHEFAGTQAAGLAVFPYTRTETVGDASVVYSGPDAATVFGGGDPVAVPLSQGVPSFAGVAVPPIVPGATPAISIVPTASIPPAPTHVVAAGVPPAPAAPSNPAPAVELDAAGLPWDARIHAGTKSKIANGTWKAKRGVEPGLLAQVEAELRACTAAAPLEQGALVVSTPQGLAPAAVSPNAAGAPTQAPEGWPFRAPAVILSADSDPISFETLMPRVTAAVIAGTLPQTAVSEACAAHGLASVVSLQTAPAMIPAVWATLKQHYPSLA